MKEYKVTIESEHAIFETQGRAKNSLSALIRCVETWKVNVDKAERIVVELVK